MTKLLRHSLDLFLGRRPPELQVGALCVDARCQNVLLITSRGTGRWIIPKGWPMEGKTLAGAAAQEAWEEAGVKGQIETQEIGRYRYGKVRERGFATQVDVRVFRLNVDTLEDDFPEANERNRTWYAPRHAAELVDEQGLKTILRNLHAAGAG